MSFESRYHRFSSIKSMSFLSERLYGPLQVKHAIYLMFSIMFAWRGLSSGNPNALGLAMLIVFVGLVSAVVGVKTLSFEAKAALTLLSLFDSLFSSEPKRGRAEMAMKSRTRKILARAGPWPRLRLGRTAKMLAPALAIAVPPTSIAVVLVVQSGLEPYAKAVLVAYMVSSIAIPIALGMRGAGV